MYLLFTLLAYFGADFRTHIACRKASLECAKIFGTLGPLPYSEIIGTVVA